ncbi:MAG: hypothetical protein P8Z78_07570 [Gammaproteobacteria bacterium]
MSACVFVGFSLDPREELASASLSGFRRYNRMPDCTSSASVDGAMEVFVSPDPVAASRQAIIALFVNNFGTTA